MTPILGIMASAAMGSKQSSFESIATVTAAGGETSLSLSSIPSTYKSLHIRAIARQSGNGGLGYWMQANSTASYTNHFLQTDGTSVTAYGDTGTTYHQVRCSLGQSTWTTGIFGVSIIDIIDYASTTKNKTIRSFAGGDTNGVGTFPSNLSLNSSLATGVGTTAFSSLQFYPIIGTWVAGSTFALYGIKGQIMAAGATYEPIQTYTLASAAPSITFSSIASSWTDLRLVIIGTAAAANYVTLNLNSDTGANYSQTILYGNGTGAYTFNQTGDTFMWPNTLGWSTTIPQLITFDLFSYAGSTYKTALVTASGERNLGNANQQVSTSVSLWRSSSAITAVSIGAQGANISIGTTATLYGIRAAQIMITL